MMNIELYIKMYHCPFEFSGSHDPRLWKYS